MSLKEYVSHRKKLKPSQVCNDEALCSLANVPGKLSFDLTIGDDASKSPIEATAAILAACNDEALQNVKTARSVRKFLLLRVRARRRAGDVAFRQHWARMRMKAITVLGAAERAAAIRAPFPSLASIQLCALLSLLGSAAILASDPCERAGNIHPSLCIWTSA